VASTRWDKRFFLSTRGRVASLLRRGGRTVDELATELALTDNAVRAHLAALERDGLVAQGDLRRNGGKPAFTYLLTPEAERLFPKAYGVLLSQLLSAVSERLAPAEMNDILQQVGHRLAAEQPAPAGDLSDRVNATIRLFAELGGSAEAEETTGGFAIQGCDCPIAAAVAVSPDACQIAETLLTDLIGVPVQRRCDPGPPPRCRFELPGA
jgi:predicted ArsR family transcriptional regulator